MHESDIVCLPQLLSALYIEADSFDKPGEKRQQGPFMTQKKDGEYNAKSKLSSAFL